MVNGTAKRGLRQFHAGDVVHARNYGRGKKWLPGVVTEVLNSRHYMVKVFGYLWKRHVDQLPRRPIDDTPPANSPAIQRHFVPNDVTSLWTNRWRLFLIPLVEVHQLLLRPLPMNLI